MIPQPPLIAAVLLAVAATAAAQPVTRTEVVRFGDLDLAAPADAKELRTRVKRAAHRVCADIAHGDLSLGAQNRTWVCEAAAIQNALRAAAAGLATPVLLVEARRVATRSRGS